MKEQPVQSAPRNEKEEIKMSNAAALKKPLNTQSGTATIAETKDPLARFLMERGLCPETAAKYGVTASAGRIEIPYMRDGQIINRKYRGIAEKTFYQDGGSQFLWNIDVLKDESLNGEPLIITEGEFDALAAIQAGYPRVLSVPNGAPAQKETATLSYLDEVEGKLRGFAEIILCTDNDEAGQNLQHDLSIRLGKARCKWVKYPQGCKDLNDALRLYGEKGVQETIKRASWIRVDGVYKMSELPPLPYKRPHSIGIHGFENHLNIRMGDFSVVTGIPGHGKTAFVNDMMCRLTEKHGFKIAVGSFEQEPQTDHKRNLRTWYAAKLEKYMSETEKQNADKWIDDKFVFITPNEDSDATLEWVLERAAVAVIQHQAKIIIIDPWNELDHTKPKDISLTEYTGFAIKQFKKFAKKYLVHVMVVAHPAKLKREKDGDYPVPTLYDISDSAHWYNKTDVGIVVYRGAEGDIVRIAKSKYHQEIGKPGDVDVKYNPETGRYMVVDNDVLNS